MLSLRQYELTFAKPNGGMEARQKVVWTGILCLSGFPSTRDLVVRVGLSTGEDKLQTE